MYRPNRIGPYPLTSIDGALYNINTSVVDTFLGDTRTFTVLMDDGSPPEFAKARRITVTGTQELAADESYAIGIQISGTALGKPFILGAAGSVSFQAEAGIRAIPFVGRSATVADTISGISTYDLLPCTSRSDGFISYDTGLVAGQFGSAASESSNALITGCWFINTTGAALDVTDVTASFSLQRYLQDIPTFDPNR